MIRSPVHGRNFADIINAIINAIDKKNIYNLITTVQLTWWLCEFRTIISKTMSNASQKYGILYYGKHKKRSIKMYKQLVSSAK